MVGRRSQWRRTRTGGIGASKRLPCAAGSPKTVADLDGHNCLLAGAQDIWRLDGPDGPQDVRVKGNMRSNSAEFVRSGLMHGLGLALRATWDIGPEVERGELVIVMPEYSGSAKNAIYAVYPCREFMPAKVNAFIEFFAELFEKDGAWARTINARSINTASATSAGLKAVRRPAGKVA